MKICIVTDSTCDLPAGLIKEHQITVIPLYINIGDKGYRDGIDMTRSEFYTGLADFSPPPTTAAPSTEVFRQTYEQLAAQGATEILSIHISEHLSAIAAFARQAAKETTSVPVTVVDSRQLSLGTGFQVLKAAQLAEEGCPKTEILSRLDDQVKRTHVFAMLDTLVFLSRSGRMKSVISFLGSLLQLRPILTMYNGKSRAEPARTREGALRRLADMIAHHRPYEKAAILHSYALERASIFLEGVRHLLPDGEIMIEEITPVLGAHIGPGVIGFAGVSKKSNGRHIIGRSTP